MMFDYSIEHLQNGGWTVLRQFKASNDEEAFGYLTQWLKTRGLQDAELRLVIVTDRVVTDRVEVRGGQIREAA
jgi:hypothetical protein